jgi:UDP-GlcNAc:undecaprenyl-phosphate/decaprenyl-phosphate GlcNAc-1-phosphate transferase
MPTFPFLALLAFSGVAALVLCANAKSLGAYFRLMDVPDARKMHRVVTPLMGGVIILLAFVPTAFLAILMTASERWLPTLLIWLGCVAALVVVGIADDRHSLSPRARLVISFAVFASAAAIDPTFNVRILDFEYPRWTVGLGTWWLAIIFTVVCLVGLINAVNMADGKNGLVIGLCLGWLALLSSRTPDALLPIMSILATVLIVLLAFNLKGRLFLGDGGAYGLACALGLLAIMIYNTSGPHALRAISADELVFLFLVPVFDSFRLTHRRMKQGRSPMAPDRDHLHHHLQDKLGWPGGLVVYVIIFDRSPHYIFRIEF